jgi:hypothetical protein
MCGSRFTVRHGGFSASVRRPARPCPRGLCAGLHPRPHRAACHSLSQPRRKLEPDDMATPRPDAPRCLPSRRRHDEDIAARRMVALSSGPISRARHRCGDQRPGVRISRVLAVVGCGDGGGDERPSRLRLKPHATAKKNPLGGKVERDARTLHRQECQTAMACPKIGLYPS